MRYINPRFTYFYLLTYSLQNRAVAVGIPPFGILSVRHSDRLRPDRRPRKITPTLSEADRRRHRGKRKTVDRVKIHDRQTFVADVGLYLWDRHPTNVYQ